MNREKARIPAWTDRILRKGTNLRQINYNSAPLRFSDHRPVYATFQCTVSIIDEAVRESLSREIYEKRRREVGGTTANTADDDTDDEDLIGYDPIEPGLPPASSDKRKWWLDNGKPARSDLKPSTNGAVPNPNRPSNPYTVTDEPDWVTVPRMPTRQKSSTQFAPPPPNPRQTSNPIRKLPPPFTPTGAEPVTRGLAQLSMDGPNGSQMPRSTMQSIQANSERRGSTSTNGSISRKPPPVAKKPVHLISSPSFTSSPTVTTSPNGLSSRATQVPTQKQQQTTANQASFPPPPRRGTGLGSTTRKDTATPPPPPQPRRAGTDPKTRTTGRAAEGQNDTERRPGLPPRPPANLLDDDNHGMNGWEALKPT